MYFENDPVLLFSLVSGFLMVWNKKNQLLPSTFWGMGLTTILVASGVLVLLIRETESAPSVSLLVTAILLSCFCAVLGQKGSSPLTDCVAPTLLLGGLGLGAVVGVEPVNRIFMIGLLSYAGFFLIRHMGASLQKTLALVHVGLALMFSFVTVFMEEGGPIWGNLFLLITFLPLVPFHLPFLGIVRSSQASLAGVWVVVWLASGLSQLKDVEVILALDGKGIFPMLALGSALYASLKAMGHRLPREGIAYATITLLALLWGLIDEFTQLTTWGIPFGIAVALFMTAILFSFAFLQERYGAHSLTTLQGLGAGLPRFRVIFTLLISLIILLPVLPVVSGLTTIPPEHAGAHSLFPVFLLLLTVWLSVSWVFTTMLHQTAFGKPRTDVPTRDLSAYEIWALVLLIGAANFFGILA